MAPKGKTAAKADTGANLGFEAKLWQMADGLHNNMDAAEYKHVVLGLIFLKYISDAFEAKHAELETQRNKGADPEDPDEYKAANIFWVPKEARWSYLKANAPQPTIARWSTMRWPRSSAITPPSRPCCKRLRASRPRQDTTRTDHQFGQRYRPWSYRQPRQGHSGPCL